MPKVVNIYTGADGESHFKDIEIPLSIAEGTGGWSKPIKTKEFLFRGAKGQVYADYHNVPYRQLIVIVEGELEIETADGSKRLCRPGDMLLAEDVKGHGHKSRTLNRVALIIPLEEEQPLA